MVIILFTLSLSGCTIDSGEHRTFGEKDPATSEDLYILNSTEERRDINQTSYYYVTGYIANTADVFVSDVLLSVSFYNENGTQIGTITSQDVVNTGISPSSIPPMGESWFGVRIADPDMKIVSYKINLEVL